MTKSGYKSISRIDQPRKHHHGWYVRVTWNKQTYPKFFSDAHYDGKTRALEAAITYRNQVEREVGKPRSERQVLAKPRPSNTGVRGVRRTTSTRCMNGKTYTWDVYRVTTHPTPGVFRRATVSIQKYGEEEAFRRACAIRRAADCQQSETIATPTPPRKHQGLTKRYLKQGTKCRVTFRVPARVVREAEAETIAVVGDFNDWLPTPLKQLRGGDFTVSLILDVTRTYHYRYLLDGCAWMLDSFADRTVRNEYGTKNSAITI